MPSMEDYAFSLQMRDTIQKLVTEALDKERPRYRYAKVQSIDRANWKCAVVYNGETGAVNVNMGMLQPAVAGQTVRVEGIGTDKFITDVIGRPYVATDTVNVTNDITARALILTQDINARGATLSQDLAVRTVNATTRLNGATTRLTSTTDLSETSTGHAFQIGPDTGTNLGIDNNEIMVRNNGVASQLFLTSPRASAESEDPPAASSFITRAQGDARFVVDSGDKTWRTATYQSGWVDYNTDFPGARYMKLSTGLVLIQGLIKSGSLDSSATGANPVCTLPAGFRSSRHLMFSNLGNTATARIDVWPNGRITVVVGSPAVWTNLTGIFYYADA